MLKKIIRFGITLLPLRFVTWIVMKIDPELHLNIVNKDNQEKMVDGWLLSDDIIIIRTVDNQIEHEINQTKTKIRQLEKDMKYSEQIIGARPDDYGKEGEIR